MAPCPARLRRESTSCVVLTPFSCGQAALAENPDGKKRKKDGTEKKKGGASLRNRPNYAKKKMIIGVVSAPPSRCRLNGQRLSN